MSSTIYTGILMLESTDWPMYLLFSFTSPSTSLFLNGYPIHHPIWVQAAYIGGWSLFSFLYEMGRLGQKFFTTTAESFPIQPPYIRFCF